MTRIVVERENVLKKNLAFIHHNISDISFYNFLWGLDNFFKESERGEKKFVLKLLKNWSCLRRIRIVVILSPE